MTRNDHLLEAVSLSAPIWLTGLVWLFCQLTAGREIEIMRVFN